MNSFFVYIDTLDKFLSKKISVNETNTKYITGLLDGEEISCSPSEVDITWTQLVFIKSLQKIWTHGKFYNNSEKETEEEKKAITDYYTNQYLTFVAKEQGTFMFTPRNNNVISYSTDDGSTWTNGNSVQVNSGDKVMWKGTMTPASYQGIGSFSASTNSFDVQGNAMSLLHDDNFKNQTDLSGKNFAFYCLFKGTKVVNAKNLSLPSTALVNYCYNNMFSDCTSLLTAPELPATTLAFNCYSNMFSGCTSLTTVPELPATTLADECYWSMFQGCTNLTAAPKLLATTLAGYCYVSMFQNCTSLTTAPELLATTLADNCYSFMFQGCTSLTTAPKLPAITLKTQCYFGMFRNCSNLNSITCLATDISATDCTGNWVDGVAASGTFIKADNMSDWTTGVNGIPSGWATHTETDEELVHKYELDQKTSKTINKTWSELKSLRDNSQLVPGQWYRITDYITTTAQANTQSAGHAFDVIVSADDVNVLNENAYAALHAGDTYFSTAGAKLEAWELKYCIDNDTTRFAWADDTNGKGVIYYMKDEFENECPYDFKNIMFERWYGSGITTSQTATEDMTTAMEEMFVSHYHSYSSSDLTLGNSGLVIKIDSNDSKFFYTFSLCSKDGETFESDDNETVYDGSLKHYGDNMYTNNVIKEYLPFDESDIIHKLNNIVFKPIDSSADDCGNNVFGKNCYDMTIGFSWTVNNTFGNDCGNNTFGNECYDNSFGNDCGNNTFGNGCYRNTFGNDCDSNTFGNDCSYNSFGNECGGNTFGNSCGSNTFGNNCYSNSFGNSCNYNSFGNYCENNTFGNNCYYNTFGNYCRYNTFGNNCYSNSFGNGCNYITFAKNYMYYNIVENGNQYITVTSTQTTSSSEVIRNFTIAQGVNNTTTNKTISHNTVNDTFQTIYQPANSQTISV